MLQLSDKLIFSSGGNRICYVHPQDPNHCLKIIRPDRIPSLRRADKHFWSRLLPLDYYDENRVEHASLSFLHENHSHEIRQHLPKSYGMTLTDLGWAHETDLIRDESGLISETLEQYIWNHGIDIIASRCINSFKENWSLDTPSTRALIPHNIVLQRSKAEDRLILIDGFGRKPTFGKFIPKTNRRGLYQRRMNDFDARIKKLLRRKQTDTGPIGRLNNLKR